MSPNGYTEAGAGFKIVSEVLSFGVGKFASKAVDNAAVGMVQKLRVMLIERFGIDETFSVSSTIVTRALA